MKNYTIGFICGLSLALAIHFGVLLFIPKEYQNPVQPIWKPVAPVCTLEYREVRPAPEALSFTF